MHRADAAAQHAAAHRIMFDEVGDLEQRRCVGHGMRRRFRGAPARRQMVVAPVLQRRIFGAAALDRQRAARREGAARRQVGQGRHHAGNFHQPRIGVGAERRHRRHRCHQAAGVGMPGIFEQRLDAGFLDLLAGIHHDDALRGLRDHAEIVRDQDQPGAEFLLQLDDQRQDLGLNGDVECGGRLVGDQQRRAAGQRHRDHGALAHAAGELMRIFPRPLLGLGYPHQAQHVDRLVPGFLGGQLAMQPNRLGDLVADPHHRVERGHRLLEDHRDAVAADRAHLGLVEAEQVGAFERHAAADDPARRIRHQPHDRQRGDALAAAGLADDRQRLAAANAERNVVDRPEQPRIGEEHRLQVLHVENHLFRRYVVHQPRCLGSRMSRSASPNRLVPNTARLIATPGKITSHGAVRTYSAADSDSMRPHDG